MSQTDVASRGRPAFEKLSDAPYKIRCQTKQALVDAVSCRDSAYAQNSARGSPGAQPSVGVSYSVLESNGLPYRGEQEIRFFDLNFGVIISDFTFMHDFDYEFVYEDLGFIQFRTGDALVRRPGARRGSASMARPSCKVSVAPSGHVDDIHYFGGSRWETITAFFDAQAIERVFDFDAAAADEALARLRHLKQQFETTPQRLSADMLNALHAVRTCQYTGGLRRAYFEAKTIELMCLSLGLAAQRQAARRDVRLNPRIRTRLEHARAILDADSVNSPTLAELARQVGINRRTLATGFRQLFDQSVYQYALGNRMALAKSQLLGGATNVARVADLAGYSDQATFSRAFRRVFGHPPSYYLPGQVQDAVATT